MTDKQENKLSMLKAVQQVLADNTTIVATPAAFATAITDLNTVVTEISSAAEIQAKNMTGTTKDKEQAAKAAITKAETLIGPGKSYATASADNTFLQQINYSATDLSRLRDTALTNVLNDVKVAITTQLANLADYGVAAADLTDLATLITTYDTLTNAPRNATTIKSAATKAITAGLKNALPVLVRLDGLADAKKAAHIDFYNTYKSARIIVDNHGGGKKAKQ